MQRKSVTGEKKVALNAGYVAFMAHVHLLSYMLEEGKKEARRLHPVKNKPLVLLQQPVLTGTELLCMVAECKLSKLVLEMIADGVWMSKRNESEMVELGARGEDACKKMHHDFAGELDDLMQKMVKAFVKMLAGKNEGAVMPKPGEEQFERLRQVAYEFTKHFGDWSLKPTSS